MIKHPKHILLAALSSCLLLSSPLWATDLTPSSTAKAAPHQTVMLPEYQTNQKTSLEMEKGQVVLVDFWASWCGPCRESFPWMTSIQAKYNSQGLKVIAINLDQEHEQALDFLKEFKPGFTVLFDTEAQLPEDFGVIGMPTSFLIDRQGKIRATHVGFHQKNIHEYESAIVKLLAEKGE
ncbi:TlpA disulfide reductase family protein [Marinomonas sp. IMCC 4694]|uniref:TlpA disulfide reductase family protein n=1 Tax=Marinomonas sp. IMCC 4694 TaxID=2605432 RepID=UPI0011E88BD9|nr:TlpA disulfide reductase family protein [Marinomonas sp. IMCC 4694]TYL46634.1 TlpA family protein disulfide reductase [Marinomonas sp. IMCC 4694]